MKKTLISLTMILSAAACVSAQNSVQPGVRVAWDYSCPATNINGIGSGSGVSAGALVDVPIYKGLFFEPGVSFFYDTTDLDYFDIYVDGNRLGPDGTLRNTGFRAPLLFGWRFNLLDDMALSIITGPSINYGLSNKVKYSEKAFKDIDLYDWGWRRWDVQWTAGIKLHYMDNFFAEITGSIGLTNQIGKGPYSASHQRRNMVNVGVGYSF